jgi:hypothetical protein
MSTWRRKAIACLPEEREEYQKAETTIYQVFFDLLQAVREAHLANDTELLTKYYDFAEWCFHQKRDGGYISNSAAVAFYEHLGDDEETLVSMHLWVDEEIFKMVRPLLWHRLADEKMERIDALYRGYHNKKNR